MIIVEGPDGAGKTTLINRLSEYLKLPISPRVVSKQAEAMVDMKQWVDNNLAAGKQNMLFDRHRLISDPIYSTVLRRHNSPGFEDIHWMMPRVNALYRMKPAIVYCLPPLEVVMANVKDDPDNVVVAATIEQVYGAYVAKAAMDLALAPGSVWIWDFTRTPHTPSGLPFWINELADQFPTS